MPVTDLAPSPAHNNRPALPASFAGVTGVYGGYDRAQAWFKTPLSADEIAKIQSAGIARIVTFREHAHFDPLYRRRYVFTVPSDDALATLNELREPKDYLLNLVEPGLSINFADTDPKVASFWYVAKTWIKSYHRGEQGVRFVGEGDCFTRYSGPANARNVDALYCDRPCRFTGEVDCLHPDRRIKGASACRAAGFATFQDMIDFDHVAFWRSNLRLYEIDAQKLGRLQRNRQSGQRRRMPSVIERNAFRYDPDLRTGITLIRAAGRTNQEVLDRYRHVLPIKSCLTEVDIEPILKLLALDK